MKKFLTSLQGHAIYENDILYNIEDKKFVTVTDIFISEDGIVFFKEKESDKLIYIENCVKFNDPSVLCSVHVDNFIDSFSTFNKENNEMEEYARFFFLLHRLPAYMQGDFKKYIEQFKLFCYYNNKKYRVTGCSRMGDIWLAKDFNQDTGYDLRVCVNEVVNFSDK